MTTVGQGAPDQFREALQLATDSHTFGDHHLGDAASSALIGGLCGSTNAEEAHHAAVFVRQHVAVEDHFPREVRGQKSKVKGSARQHSAAQ